MLISSNPLEYGSCYYLSMVEGRNVTVSMHSAIIPTKIVLQHIISADTDENVINLFVLSPPPPNAHNFGLLIGVDIRGEPVLRERLGLRGGRRIPVADSLMANGRPQEFWRWTWVSTMPALIIYRGPQSKGKKNFLFFGVKNSSYL